MRNIIATGNLYGEVATIKQVSKQAAKKAFAAGKEVYLQSSNMYPFGIWQSVCPIKLDEDKLERDRKHNLFCIELYSEQVETTDLSKELIEHYQAKLKEHQEKVINSDTQFNQRVNEYKWYNCDNERGNYVTFYLKS